MRSSHRLFLFALATLSFAGFSVAVGCSDDGSSGATPDAAGVDGSDAKTSTTLDSSSDAGTEDVLDAARAKRDANGPGEAGTECSFNHDCQLGLRCECNGLCSCTPGMRGTTPPGAGCMDGNDCESSVCLEGPNDVLVCSDECETGADCPANLPICQLVVSVGKICTRQP